MSKDGLFELMVDDGGHVDISHIIAAIIPLLTIMILKDQFSDFEELRVLTPAREEAINLLV